MDQSRSRTAIGRATAACAVAFLVAFAAGACSESGTIGATGPSPHAPTASSRTSAGSTPGASTQTPSSPSAQTPAGQSPSIPASTTPSPAPPAPTRSDADTVVALSVPVQKVNPTWVAQLLPGGDATTTNTLDLCGASYPSEAKRTARRQMQYGSSTDDLPLSNEVVTYRDGGAAQALTEVKDAIAHCPGGLVQEKDLHGGRAIYHVSKMIVTSSTWLTGTIAIVVRLDHEDGTSYTYAEVIQSRGNVVSIIYGPLDGQVASAETMKAANVAADLLATTPLSV